MQIKKKNHQCKWINEYDAFSSLVGGKKMRLANITWPQAEAYFKDHDTVIVPLGSTECHGFC